MARRDEGARREAARGGWRYWGQERPPFAHAPGPDQESVWDYPRPPRVEPELRRVEVYAGGHVVADSGRAMRVLETASPPTVYVPPSDVRMELFERASGTTVCEWKGDAIYYDVVTRDGRVSRAAWSYPDPRAGFEAIAGLLAFYPRLLTCRLGGETVAAQPGGFYGGWLTADVVGPVKGEPGVFDR